MMGLSLVYQKTMPTITRAFNAPKWMGTSPRRQSRWTKRYKLPKYARGLMARPERYIVFHGGRGGGKSTTIAVIIVEYCRSVPGTRVVIIRDYKTSSEDTALQLVWDICESTGVDAYKARTGLRIYFGNGSRVSLLGSERNYGQLRGLERVSIAWIEEGQDVSEEGFQTLTPSVRGPNAKIFVSFNPQDIEDYVSQHFIEDPRPNSYIMKINYRDYPEAFNPATEDEYQESLRRGDPNHEHIWGGAYRNALGLIFDASKINLTEAISAEGLAVELGVDIRTIVRCRAWDFGATKGSGDFTVGMRMARLGSDDQAVYMIEDIARGRWSPDETDAESVDVAVSDGINTVIRITQDPGAAGVRDNSRVTKMLVPWTNTLISEPVSGSKVKRCAGFASAVNNGLVYAPQASWLRPLQRELRSFTGLRTDIDDQVDTGADAYELLSSRIRERRGVLAI